MMEDIHAETAKKLFGKVTPDTKARAKIINYARMYGAGQIKLGRIAGYYPLKDFT